MRLPKVTVVLPAYNYERWVGAAIESALAQDYPADLLEIVVVDDGSTDGTPAVVAGYAARNAGRVRVIRRENGGLNAATSTGIAAASGELITFLDADDLWPADRTRLLVDALTVNPKAGIAFGDMEIIDAGGTTIHPSFRRYDRIDARTDDVLPRLTRGNFISAGSLMIRADLRDRYAPIPSFSPYNDWWMAIQVAQVAEIVAIDGIVNRYRHHGDNMNLGYSDERLLGLQRSELPMRRWIVANVTASGRSIDQQLGALGAYDAQLKTVALRTGAPAPAAAHPTSDEERARAAELREQAAAHAARGDDALAAEALIRAAALEPDADRHELAVAVHRLSSRDQPQARGHLGFASLARLLADPAPLAAWAERHDAAADATLVIGGVRGNADVDALVELLHRVGVDSEDGPDLLTVAEADPDGASRCLGRAVRELLVGAAAPLRA